MENIKLSINHSITNIKNEINYLFIFQVYFIISSHGSPRAELQDKITLHNIIKTKQNKTKQNNKQTNKPKQKTKQKKTKHQIMFTQKKC